MKSSFKFLLVILFVLMLVQFNPGLKCNDSSSNALHTANGEGLKEEVKFPWIYGGYRNEGQLHLRYFYFAREAIEKVNREDVSWDEAIKGRSGIVEIWFKKDGGLLRVDRYLEKLKRPCESFEGGDPETISYEGKTYTLFERVVQKGLQHSKYAVTSRSKRAEDGTRKRVCVYEKSSRDLMKEPDHDSVFVEITRGETAQPIFWLYSKHSDMNKQLEVAGLEMAKMMKPAKYKKILDGWKDKKTIVGREAVRHNDSAPVFGGGEGYEYIDIKLGIGLIGYLEEFRDLSSGKKTSFAKPTLIYKALIVETSVSDDIFEGL